MLDKRDFLKLTAGGVIGAAGAALYTGSRSKSRGAVITASPALSPITQQIKPISIAERKTRIAELQRHMQSQNIAALVLEPGTTMVYFTGVAWRRSERLLTAVVPAEGALAFVAPYFEEPRLRERMTFGDDVRSWHEHESPFQLVADIIKDHSTTAKTVAFEDSVRVFVQRDIMASLSNDYHMVSGRGVVNACRMIKSPHELSLMHKANAITLAAYAHVFKALRVGMSQNDIAGMMGDAQNQLGGSGTWAMALIGEGSAYPHGTKKIKTLAEGDVLLMDCGTAVEGYQSDISRTLVFGEPTARQRQIWNTVRTGQQVAFEAAKIGAPAGSVDDAVRAYYESLGYGPGYATPGLSHRTGHGIGMDGHEMANFVHGDTTLLAEGMCFSNEPGIYIYGEFGVRLEDCLYMTSAGPRWFSEPPASLDAPLGQMVAL